MMWLKFGRIDFSCSFFYVDNLWYMYLFLHTGTWYLPQHEKMKIASIAIKCNGVLSSRETAQAQGSARGLKFRRLNIRILHRSKCEVLIDQSVTPTDLRGIFFCQYLTLFSHTLTQTCLCNILQFFTAVKKIIFR